MLKKIVILTFVLTVLGTPLVSITPNPLATGLAQLNQSITNIENRLRGLDQQVSALLQRLEATAQQKAVQQQQVVAQTNAQQVATQAQLSR
ncbi:hypothetical protein HOD08_03385 [bacterium]|nr:hypothetical protein [bacterium]